MPHLPHALVVAAIFVPYMGLMIGLGAYIYRTGQPPRSDGDQEKPAAGRDRNQVEISLAA